MAKKNSRTTSETLRVDRLIEITRNVDPFGPPGQIIVQSELRSADVSAARLLDNAYASERKRTAWHWKRILEKPVHYLCILIYCAAMTTVLLYDHFCPGPRGRAAVAIVLSCAVIDLEDGLKRFRSVITVRQRELIHARLFFDDTEGVDMLLDAACLLKDGLFDSVAHRLISILPRFGQQELKALGANGKECLNFLLRPLHVSRSQELAVVIIHMFERTLHDQVNPLMIGLLKHKNSLVVSAEVAAAAEHYVKVIKGAKWNNVS